ncbi:MAG: NAD(P)H-dependent oxidoreductase [Nitrococcus sp.]|nr:NAD(P)H-dependent oxidoreductase [Nitrococcus sp.]
MTNDFSDLKAIFLNCSIKYDPASSHTRRLMARSAGIMDAEGVSVDFVHLLEHDIAFGMVKDAKADSVRATDEWPGIQDRIVAADILVLGTPIWLGMKSSVAMLCIERMYAYSGDGNEKGQYLYYAKTAGCIVTGNEDGSQGLLQGDPLRHVPHRLHDPAPGRLRLDRRSRPRPELRRRRRRVDGPGRIQQRLHAYELHGYVVEPGAHCSPTQGCRWSARRWECVPALA